MKYKMKGLITVVLLLKMTSLKLRKLCTKISLDRLSAAISIPLQGKEMWFCVACGQRERDRLVSSMVLEKLIMNKKWVSRIVLQRKINSNCNWGREGYQGEWSLCLAGREWMWLLFSYMDVLAFLMAQVVLFYCWKYTLVHTEVIGLENFTCGFLSTAFCCFLGETKT